MVTVPQKTPSHSASQVHVSQLAPNPRKAARGIGAIDELQAQEPLQHFVFPPQSVALPEPETGARIFDFEKFRTVTCNSYRRGKNCSFEKKCFFAHGPNELRRNPYVFPYSSELCPDAKETKSCQHGNDCKFSRNFTEYLYHPKRYKTRLCENHFKGKCERGDTCAFIHDRNPSTVKAPRTISIDFHSLSPITDPTDTEFVRTHAVNPIVALLNGSGGKLIWNSVKLSQNDVAVVQNLINALMFRIEPAPKPDCRLFEASWSRGGQDLISLVLNVSGGDSSEVYFNDQDQAFVLSEPQETPLGLEAVRPIHGRGLVELCRQRFMGNRQLSFSDANHPSIGKSTEVSPCDPPHPCLEATVTSSSKILEPNTAPNDPFPLPYDRFTPAPGAVFIAGSGAFSPHCGSFSPLIDESRQCTQHQSALWKWPARAN